MPRDSRLYMTFPIDIHRHPKLRRLTPAAKWAFVEMNGEARIAENDGRFTAEDAEFMWGADVLAELTGSHPTRPLVARDGSDYVIRDYAQHQFTTEDRERLAKISRDNGAKGGRPRNPEKPAWVSSKPGRTQTKPESESGVDDSSKTSKSQSLDNRAREATDSLSPVVKVLADQVGIGDVPALRNIIHEHTGCRLTLDRTVTVGRWLIEKSPKPVARGQAYATKCVRETPLEVQQYIHEQGLAE